MLIICTVIGVIIVVKFNVYSVFDVIFSHLEM